MINKSLSVKKITKLFITLVTSLGNIKYYKIIFESGICKIVYIILKKVEKSINKL